MTSRPTCKTAGRATRPRTAPDHTEQPLRRTVAWAAVAVTPVSGRFRVSRPRAVYDERSPHPSACSPTPTRRRIRSHAASSPRGPRARRGRDPVQAGDAGPASRPAPTGSTCSTRPATRPCAASSRAGASSVDGIVGAETYRALDEARWRLGRPGAVATGSATRSSATTWPSCSTAAGAGLRRRPRRRHLRRPRPRRRPGVPAQRRPRADGTCGPHTLKALARLRRTVAGGRAQWIRETEELHRAGPGAGRQVDRHRPRPRRRRPRRRAMTGSRRPSWPRTWPPGSRAGSPPSAPRPT